jgi:hypothetical protein
MNRSILHKKQACCISNVGPEDLRGILSLKDQRTIAVFFIIPEESRNKEKNIERLEGPSEDLEDEPKRFQNSKNSEDCGLASRSSEEHKVIPKLIRKPILSIQKDEKLIRSL